MIKEPSNQGTVSCGHQQGIMGSLPRVGVCPAPGMEQAHVIQGQTAGIVIHRRAAESHTPPYTRAHAHTRADCLSSPSPDREDE